MDREFCSKLDELTSLLYSDTPEQRNSISSTNATPLEKLNNLYDLVKHAMEQYFKFMALFIKYDAMQNGQVCTLDISELYTEVLNKQVPRSQWPEFVRAKLTADSSPSLSPSSDPNSTGPNSSLPPLSRPRTATISGHADMDTQFKFSDPTLAVNFAEKKEKQSISVWCVKR